VRERDRVDPVAMALECAEAFAGRCPPDPDGLVARCRCEQR
jgi:hypothetical protein